MSSTYRASLFSSISNYMGHYVKMDQGEKDAAPSVAV